MIIIIIIIKLFDVIMGWMNDPIQSNGEAAQRHQIGDAKTTISLKHKDDNLQFYTKNKFKFFLQKIYIITFEVREWLKYQIFISTEVLHKTTNTISLNHVSTTKDDLFTINQRWSFYNKPRKEIYNFQEKNQKSWVHIGVGSSQNSTRPNHNSKVLDN